MIPDAGKLLVVDDNLANRDVLSRHLLREGYRVAQAVDGLQALQALATDDIDLMLLDIHMPHMDGFQVLERMRGSPRLGEVPVIVISSDRELEGVVRCIELGAEDYLPKPFNSVLLRARVRRSLEKRWARKLEREHLAQIERDKEHVERLLHTLFPRYAAEELKATNHLTPVRFNDVAILFCDIVNYTRYSEAHLPEHVLADLHALFVAFEEITDRYRVEKISAMGDEYMAVAGFEPDRRDAVFSSVAAGLEMIAAAKRLPTQFDVRIGVHVGNVVGGIVGNKKFHYSVWGDAVNVASRMQSNGLVGSVNVSRAAWEALHGAFPGKSRGVAEIKGKGPMEMFIVYPRGATAPLGAVGD